MKRKFLSVISILIIAVLSACGPALIPSLPTLTPSSTLALIPTLPDTSATDLCNELPPIKPVGDTVKIKFLNKTDGNVNLSFGMTKENDKKECGTYTFYIPKYDEPVVEVLAGCYWGFGYINGDKPSTPQTADALCVTDTTKTTSIWVTKDLISFH
jgi:hypothetical protein